MAKKSIRSQTVTGGPAQAYFAYVTTPRERKRTLPNGEVETKKEYSVTLVFENDEAPGLRELKDLVSSTAAQAFPGKGEAASALKKQGQLAIAQSKDDITSAIGPFRTAGSGSKYFPEDSVRVEVKSNAEYTNGPPVVVGTAPDETGSPAVLAANDIYSGMIVKVRLNAYSFDNEQQGVNLGLGDAIQKVAAGERLGTQREDAQDVFSADPNAEPVNSLDQAAKAAQAAPSAAMQQAEKALI